MGRSRGGRRGGSPELRDERQVRGRNGNERRVRRTYSNERRVSGDLAKSDGGGVRRRSPRSSHVALRQVAPPPSPIAVGPLAHRRLSSHFCLASSSRA